MKKIPTLFTRVYENHKIIGIENKITPGCEDAFKNGVATIKLDGSCCAIISGQLYRRYDAKKRKTPPMGAIPCCNPDPITGHWPHWIKVDGSIKQDKWFYEALNNTTFLDCKQLEDGTYEAIGPHFQGNPYSMFNDYLVKHGGMIVDVDRNFESISEWLATHLEEGLVFWLNGEPVCKIKRTDFGYEWPVKDK